MAASDWSKEAWIDTLPTQQAGNATYSKRTKTVTASASGSGDGSKANPWTLKQAMELAVAGDIVGIAAGQYFGSAVTTDPAWIDNIPAWSPKNNGKAGKPIVFVAQNLAAEVTGGYTELYSGASKSGNTRTGRPCFGTRAIGKTTHVHWIGIYSNESHAKGHIYEDCGLCTIWNAEDILISKCKLIGDLTQGGNNYSAIRAEGVNRLTISDNLMKDFYGAGNPVNCTGMTFYGVDNAVIEHNDLVHLGHGIQPKGANYGYDTVNMTVRFNHFRDCVSALRLHRPVVSSGGPRSRVYQNLIEECKFFAEITTSAGGSIVDDVDVYNNTIVKGKDKGDPGSWWWAAIGGAKTNTFYNNIFSGIGSYLGSYSASASKVAGWADYDYNCLHNVKKMFGGFSLSFSDWNSQHGQDKSSIISDPQFENSAGGDYRLKSGSPCRGKGKGGATMGAFITGKEVLGRR